LRPRSKSPPLLAALALVALVADRAVAEGDRPATPDAPLTVASSEPKIALQAFDAVLGLAAPGAAGDAVRLAAGTERRAGFELGSVLTENARGAAIALVAACPPPANLGCNPGLQVLLELEPDADRRRLTRELAALLPAGLRAAGFSELSVTVNGIAGSGVGQVLVTSAEETLGRARITADTARLALGGVDLPAAPEATGETLADGLAISLRPASLAQLLDDRAGILSALAQLTTRVEIELSQGADGPELSARATPTIQPSDE
jgi:hypothetical protein